MKLQTLPPRKQVSHKVGPVIVIHEHYQMVGSTCAEAGPAAVIHRDHCTAQDVTREALLLAATRATWSSPNGRSARDGYPLPSVIYAMEDATAFVACWEGAKALIKDEDWRRYASGMVHWVNCGSANAFGRALNLALSQGTNAVIIATCGRYQSGTDLTQFAEQLLAATFGRGAIYTV